MRILILIAGLFLLTTCSHSGDSGNSSRTGDSLTLTMTRLTSATPNPFQVTVTLKQNGVAAAGKTLALNVPKGSASSVTDNGDGTYSFTVTPSATGVYPVTVSYGSASITRKAVVLQSVMTGAGQPMAVPGDYVNTEGWEDGITITPDGQYLFLQYLPAYFTGLSAIGTICPTSSYSIGYDLNGCSGRTNSFMVFDVKGPTSAPYRPDFPTGGISNGHFLHLPSLVIGGVANGILGFPTVFYGFKKQADGTFAEPFKVAFNDARGLNGPYGLSFQMNGDGTAKFIVAWNNYLNNLGSDRGDVYAGTLTLGQNKNLGDVVYSGETFSSITPNITPVSFPDHLGPQGNPFLYYDSNGVVRTIFTDDENSTLDLYAYRLTSGTFPSGTWAQDTLPSVINTAGDERQPTFAGDRLYFTRDFRIVYHSYTATNGACASGYTSNDCWSAEQEILRPNSGGATGEIIALGEPTVAVENGKKYLYFVYVESRANSSAVGITDLNLDAGFVEIP